MTNSAMEYWLRVIIAIGYSDEAVVEDRVEMYHEFGAGGNDKNVVVILGVGSLRYVL